MYRQEPFDVLVSRGAIPGYTAVNKFGNAPDGVQTTATDIWALADSTPTQQIWLAPTAARVHAIVSTSTSDDGDPVGVGARTLQITGLQTWSSGETSETITLNGTTPVNTTNSYVIINRMRVITSGATNINVGTITATAATDSTITAVILAGSGQTQQAIYGFGTGSTLMIRTFSASIASNSATHRMSLTLKVNTQPDTQPTIFTDRHKINLTVAGTTVYDHPFEPPKAIIGPAIVKLTGISSTADLDASGHFDGYLYRP